MTYLGNEDLASSRSWHWPGDLKPATVKWTVDSVEYHGHRMSLSQVIDVEVYSNTAATVIAETNTDSGYCFFTEKTAKPLIAARPFVMLAAMGQLSALRDLGFMTFQGIIDESYDSIEDHDTRILSAISAVEAVTKLDQREFLEACSAACSHNQSVIMETDWYAEHFAARFNEFFTVSCQQ